MQSRLGAQRAPKLDKHADRSQKTLKTMQLSAKPTCKPINEYQKPSLYIDTYIKEKKEKKEETNFWKLKLMKDEWISSSKKGKIHLFYHNLH